ncbi:hypothetical protein BDR26DRAFT_872399 [Obelidium mucronatum]|nr:hypothetical protein BDR26DRAFT_872399 [Obelidium mucronatum]
MSRSHASDQTITTGWTYNSVWNNKDYSNWVAALTFKLLYCLRIAFEIPPKFKNKLIWHTIIASLLINSGATVATFFFTDCLLFAHTNSLNDEVPPSHASESCYGKLQLHRLCFLLETIAFLVSFSLLLYRKYLIMPSVHTYAYRGLQDLMVFLICSGLSSVSDLACLLWGFNNQSGCLQYAFYQSMACLISHFYFEIWFLYSVAVQSLRDSSSKVSLKQKLKILQLSLPTTLMVIIHLIGTLYCKIDGGGSGNFYTNMMWNM